jgi:hypothetical protein
VYPRAALSPATVRIRTTRVCAEAHRTLVLRVYWEDFPEPIHQTERQLEGCHGPLTWQFERELREPGVYTAMVDILPTGEHAVTSAEFR